MKLFKYFFEFIIVIFFFSIFKIIGLKNSSNLGCLIFRKVGPILRKSQKIKNNIKIVFPDIGADMESKIISEMWCNYGRVFGEYMHLQKFKKIESNYIKTNFEKFDELKKEKILFYFFQDILLTLNCFQWK